MGFCRFSFREDAESYDEERRKEGQRSGSARQDDRRITLQLSLHFRFLLLLIRLRLGLARDLLLVQVAKPSRTSRKSAYSGAGDEHAGLRLQPLAGLSQLGL